MHKFVTFTLFAVLLGAWQAHAACGGGGWKKPSSKGDGQAQTTGATTASASTSAPAPASQTSTSQASAPTTPAASSKTTSSGTSFDARFDAVSKQLNLDESQWKDVADARENVRNKITKLARKLAKAEDKLAHCTDDCEDERRDVAKARDSQNSYNPAAEFDKELRSILSSGQWSVYSTTSVSAAKKAEPAAH